MIIEQIENVTEDEVYDRENTSMTIMLSGTYRGHKLHAHMTLNQDIGIKPVHIRCARRMLRDALLAQAEKLRPVEKTLEEKRAEFDAMEDHSSSIWKEMLEGDRIRRLEETHRLAENRAMLQRIRVAELSKEKQETINWKEEGF